MDEVAPSTQGLSLSPSATIVLGAQWGDEGKGKVVDLLAQDADMVVRFQGGANAGHTVVVEDRTVVLHQIPSGIVSPTTSNVIGNGCVVDPIGLVDEIDRLGLVGIEVTPRNLVIAANAHVVTPAHRLLDRLGGGQIGTTGRGIGPCYTDKARRSGVRIESVLDGTLRERCLGEADRVARALQAETSLPLAELDRIFDLDPLLEAAERLRAHIGDGPETIHRAASAGRRILFEGAQGTFLDIDHGTYPFVTSSSTTIGGAFTGAGVYLDIPRRVGVVKAYTTRVGNGPFPTEIHGELGAMLRERGREYGATTGRPRRVGWLDLPLLRRAIVINGFTEIALTKLDVLGGLEEISVASDRDEAGAPVYRTVPGWRRDIADVRRFEDLPADCRRYVELIEEQLGVPVGIVSVGPGRGQTISREA